MFSRASLRSLARLASKPTASWQKYQSTWLIQAKYAQFALTFNSANRFSTNQKQSSVKEPTLEDIRRMVDEMYQAHTEPFEVNRPPFDWQNLQAKIEELHREPITKENEVEYRRGLKEIELSYLKDIRTPGLVPSFAIIELGFLYGKEDFGSQPFWESLVNEFTNRIDDYDLELISRFLYGASQRVVIESEFWELLTEYFTENPHDVPIEILCYLMPTVIRSFRQRDLPQENTEFDQDNDIAEEETKQQQKQQNESDENQRDFLERLREDVLWNILKDSAIEQIRDFNAYQLVTIAGCFSTLQYTDQGLWASVYEKFRAFRHEYDSKALATWTKLFAKAGSGNRELWEDMETHTIANIKDMDTNVIISFMRGFSEREEGSFKLWNEFTEQVFNRELDPAQLGQVVRSFADYELLTQANWDILENKVLESMEFLTSNQLVHIIIGFGKSEKGSQHLWDKIEENLLTEVGGAPETHLSLYTVLKSFSRLTPALAQHYESVAEEGDEILEQMREYNEAQQEHRYL